MCDILLTTGAAAARRLLEGPQTRIGVIVAPLRAKSRFSATQGAKPRSGRDLPISG
jgi:hypothetical protein